MKLNPSTFI